MQFVHMMYLDRPIYRQNHSQKRYIERISPIWNPIYFAIDSDGLMENIMIRANASHVDSRESYHPHR
jgi:hypothetical protein